RHYEGFKANPEYRLGKVPKATHGWDDVKRVTREQRRKEEASDYRYFPEPDLVPVTVSDAFREEIRAGLGELPAAQKVRLREQYGLSEYDAAVITRQGRAFVRYFEEAAQASGSAKEASNRGTTQVLQALNERKQVVAEFPLSAAALADLIRRVKDTGLNMQRAREVFAHMLDKGTTAQQAIDELGFKPIADEAQLVEIVRRAIAPNPKAGAAYQNGQTQAPHPPHSAPHPP